LNFVNSPSSTESIVVKTRVPRRYWIMDDEENVDYESEDELFFDDEPNKEDWWYQIKRLCCCLT
jgi:hypothetical protein